jgi:DNA polymerase III delta subunit
MAKKQSQEVPLLVVSGGQVLLRKRFIQTVLDSKRAEGWSIEKVDGSDAVAVRDALNGNSLFATRTLAEVHHPEKIPLELLEKHRKDQQPVTTLLLHIEGNLDKRTKFGKFVKQLSAFHKAFPLPKEWKAPEVAVEFLLEEAERHGKTIRPALARALVGFVGYDLGMLSFEVDKMACLADAKGSSIIDAEEIRGAMAPIGAASVSPLLNALSARNRKQLLRSMDRVRRTSKDDPTMRVCGLLSYHVLNWMKAAYLEALPPAAAAEELGLNKWLFETKILPPAKLWGQSGTVILARGIARAQRAVLSGAVNPWLWLKVQLVHAVSSSPQGSGVSNT